MIIIKGQGGDVLELPLLGVANCNRHPWKHGYLSKDYRNLTGFINQQGAS